MNARLKPLEQQVIVITGASSGIGLCTALMAAEYGARVVLGARSARTLDVIVEQVRRDGGQAASAAVDVADRAQVQHLADVALQHFGHVDTWINNAGVGIYGRIEQVDEDDARRLFDTNFWGVVNGSQVALPLLRRGGGALINVGSEVSDAVMPSLGFYVASKHAVKAFTDTLRMEVVDVDKAPVSITLIQPTATDTPFPQHARNYMDREPALPSPMIAPERVATAILEAATRGGHDVRIGAMAHVSTRAFRLMPRLAERMAALQEGRLRSDDEAPHFPMGALHGPRDSGQIHGGHRAP